MRGEQLGVPGVVAPTQGEVLGELLQLHEPERGAQLRRLEVPRHLVEDELVVVVDAVEVLPEVALAPLRSEEVDLRTPPPPAEHDGPVAPRVVVDHHHPAVAGGR